MSPFYVPLIVTAVVVLLTTALLEFLSRPSVSNKAFVRTLNLWSVLFFLGIQFTNARISGSPLLSGYSDSDATVFFLVCVFLGTLLPVFAVAGFYALLLPGKWQTFHERHRAIRAERRQRQVIGN